MSRRLPQLLRLAALVLPAACQSDLTGPVESVTVTAVTTALEVGDTVRLAVAVRDGAGAPVSEPAVDWRVEGEAVIVSPAGLVTAVSIGTGRVVASVAGIEGDLMFTVASPAVARVTVSPARDTVLIGESLRYTATLTSRAGVVLEGRAVAWTTADASIAAVNAAGDVTGVGLGETRVIATSEGRADTGTVRVQQPVGLTITGPDTTRQGDVVTFTASGTDRDGTPIPAAQLVWTLAPSDAGFLTATGQFVGFTPGEVRVRVDGAGAADTLSLTITPRGLSGTFGLVGSGAVTDRYTSDLWVHNGYAYTGTWGTRSGNPGNRLYVWDVRDPARPVLTDSVAASARTVNDVKVSADGTLAVLTHEDSPDGLNGITLLSLADPAHPAVITRYTTNLTAGVHNVWIDGTYVYAVADGAAGLRIIDVSTSATPVEVASFVVASSTVHDVYVRDGLAFVSHWNAGLVILDVGSGVRDGSSASPVEVSRIELGGQTHNAWYWPAAGYVFVGEEDFGTPPGIVHAVDVSDLAAPREVATFAVPGSPPHNFWVDEARGILYVGWYSNGLRAIDVSGRLLGDLSRQGREIAALKYGSVSGCPGTTGTCTWAPQVVGDLVFAADMNAGLLVLQPAFPSPRGL